MSESSEITVHGTPSAADRGDVEWVPLGSNDLPQLRSLSNQRIVIPQELSLLMR